MNATNSPEQLTLRGLLQYLILFLVVTLSFVMVPSGWLERITAQFASNALRAFGFSSNWSIKEAVPSLSLIGGIREVSVTIIRECTGIHVFAIFAGLVLPIEGGLWLRKSLSLVIAATLLAIMNISRVMLTVLLTGYNVPPFAYIFTNPTVETYHYPLSFLYGLLGVAILVIIIGGKILPELESTLLSIPRVLGSIRYNKHK